MLMISLKVDQKFQALPRENFWLRHSADDSIFIYRTNSYRRNMQKLSELGGLDSTATHRRLITV